MEFRDSPEESAFRGEVRTFIQEHLPAEYGTPAYRRRVPEEGGGRGGDTVLKGWRKSLGERGWLAPHWPKEYGGAGLSPVEQFIFNEEMAEARTPDTGGSGVAMIGPTLILYGTDEQKKEHLPRITSGEVWWCQGYSEPGAGSDLASLQTRAVRDGDEYVINGSKIWTGGAHHANWMFMLARTDPDAPKHRGISMFLIDMKTPGITVQPLVNLAGEHNFNQEYFDNVRVPARNLVGEENRGWYVGATLLDFERSLIRRVIELRQMVQDIVEYVRGGASPTGKRVTDELRAELAERMIEAEIARVFSHRIISIQKQGRVPNYESSMNKLFLADTEQRIARTGIKFIGPAGMLYRDSVWAPLGGKLAYLYLRSTSISIAGGTSEIQRNVIATRGLGLPR